MSFTFPSANLVQTEGREGSGGRFTRPSRLLLKHCLGRRPPDPLNACRPRFPLLLTTRRTSPGGPTGQRPPPGCTSGSRLWGRCQRKASRYGGGVGGLQGRDPPRRPAPTAGEGGLRCQTHRSPQPSLPADGAPRPPSKAGSGRGRPRPAARPGNGRLPSRAQTRPPRPGTPGATRALPAPGSRSRRGTPLWS